MTESQLDYMKRKLREYRDKKEANYLTHDLPLNEIIVRKQRMFPNCGKYTHCCDENWDPKLEITIHMQPKWADYTMLTKEDYVEAPEGFKVKEIKNDPN